MTGYYLAAIAVTAAAAWATSFVLTDLRAHSGTPSQPTFDEVTIDLEDFEVEPLYEIGQDGEPIYPSDTLYLYNDPDPGLTGGLP